MRKGRPLGLSPDGRSLIVAVDGERIAVPADARLRAALRGDRPRMGQLEIDMDSALRPRDIQARIRSGESIEDVALAAGVPVEQIEPYAAPVLAERDHIAGLAQGHPVRRAGETVAHRSLRSMVTDRLLSRGVDIDTVAWDAHRVAERRWAVTMSYDSGKAHHEAVFGYDQTGRFSLATNDEARWLLGEPSTSHGPQPGRRRRGDDADGEATVELNDDLALVRAIQPGFDDAVADERPDNDDAYAEEELAEIDGVYDFVPAERASLDVLYDMLSGFDEDSVQIYSGLVRAPNAEDAPSPMLDEGPVPGPDAEPEPLPAPGAPEVASTGPQQPSLVDQTEGHEPSRPIKRRRASVPSWDEIMFGSPKQKRPDH